MRTERIPVADGVELAVDIWAAADAPAATDGRGPAAAFLLVHGLASNARMWDGVAQRLSEAGHLVVTVDLRGHGRSSKPDEGYAVETVADDLAVLIERLRLDRPVVAGQSWGGNVVLELAFRHPASRSRDRLRRRWLAGPAGQLSRLGGLPVGALTAASGRPPALPRSRATSAPLIPTGRRRGIQGTLANFEVRPDGTIAPWLTFERHLVVLRGLWDHRPATRYPTIAVPVLLAPAEPGPTDAVDGPGSEHLAPRRDVEAAAAALPDGRIHWFTGDHDIHAQQPAELADVLDELARRQRWPFGMMPRRAETGASGDQP